MRRTVTVFHGHLGDVNRMFGERSKKNDAATRKTELPGGLLGVKNDEGCLRELVRWRGTRVPQKMLAEVMELKKRGVVGPRSYEFVLGELGVKRVRQARKLFEMIPEKYLTPAMFKTMLNYEADMENSRTPSYYEKFRSLGFRADSDVLTALMKFHASQGDRESCLKILSKLHNKGMALLPDTFTVLILIAEPWEVAGILQEMSERGVRVTSNVVLCVCKILRKNGEWSHLGTFLQNCENTHGVAPGGAAWAELVLCLAKQGFVQHSLQSWRYAVSLPGLSASLPLTVSLFTLVTETKSRSPSDFSRILTIAESTFTTALHLGVRDPILWIAMFNVYSDSKDEVGMRELLERARSSKMPRKEFATLQRKYAAYLKYKQ